jgi:hypothetical protein
MTQEEILQSPKFQMEAALIRKCSEEPEFRAKVLANPRGILEEALGQKLPEQLSIFIHEEDLHNIHFSIPPTKEGLQNELSDEQLEQVAGGTVVGTLVLTIAILATFTATVTAAATGISAATAAASIKAGGW